MSKLHENIPVKVKVTEWLSKMGWTLQSADDLKNDLCKIYKDEEDGLMHFDVERLPNGNLLEQMKFDVIGLLQPERVLDILRQIAHHALYCL